MIVNSLASLCLAAALALSQPLLLTPTPLGGGEVAELRRLRLPDGLVFPNGIASDADGSLYVGGVTSGQVWRRDPAGDWTILFPGSPTVYGVTSLRLDAERGVLWGASPDAAAVLGVEAGREARPHRVFALDIRTGAVLGSAVVPEGGFGNDLALDGQGGVLVSDSRLGRIWRLAPDVSTWTLAASDPALDPGNGIGPAGIARLPSGDLIVGLFGQGCLVRVRRPGPDAVVEPIMIDRAVLRPDGMAAIDDQRVVLTLGGTGEVIVVDLGSGRTRRLAAGLRGPVNVDLRGFIVLVSESGIVDPADFDPARPDRSGMSVVQLVLEALP